ncbi:hypothetical protein SKAU_G00013320 [Synaphobranchus kaupii]|uniref:Uncharacterized protein n=1 Tax=Synaphobranchus kaupii TaxID=118154 RepID=A0A9Q1GAG8_SYNKA|nr:hypothetical protein SKAU_G00013320 [Synaphobranchus kaupii]
MVQYQELKLEPSQSPNKRKKNNPGRLSRRICDRQPVATFNLLPKTNLVVNYQFHLSQPPGRTSRMARVVFSFTQSVDEKENYVYNRVPSTNDIRGFPIA